MKFAIVGSRNLTVENLDAYLPEGVREIVSGGARGVDACARMYAQAHGMRIKDAIAEVIGKHPNADGTLANRKQVYNAVLALRD